MSLDINPGDVSELLAAAALADREALFAALQAAVGCVVDAAYDRPRPDALAHVRHRLEVGKPYGGEYATEVWGES